MGRTATWTPARWASSCPDGDGSRADAAHTLVQYLADAGADAEGRPRRRVPRLEHDVSLPDQLAVVVADLVTAGTPETLAEAAEEVRRAARRI